MFAQEFIVSCCAANRTFKYQTPWRRRRCAPKRAEEYNVTWYVQ